MEWSRRKAFDQGMEAGRVAANPRCDTLYTPLPAPGSGAGRIQPPRRQVRQEIQKRRFLGVLGGCCVFSSAANMKIIDVKSIPLLGATHDTGWPGGTDPDEQMNTLLEIHSDGGLVGIGSCFTNRVFVEASLTLLKPMLIGETVFEAERISEKLRQLSFWYGRGGAVGRTISGFEIALLGLLGKAAEQP